MKLASDVMTTLSELKSETEIPVIIADERGFVTYINHCFTENYLWDSELIGKTLLEVIPINFHDSHNLGFSRFAMTEKSHIANHPIRALVTCKDGEIVLSEHYIIAERVEGHWFFGARLRPL